MCWEFGLFGFWTITIDLLKFLCRCKPVFFSLSLDHKFLLLLMLSIIFLIYCSLSFNNCLSNCLALHFFCMFEGLCLVSNGLSLVYGWYVCLIHNAKWHLRPVRMSLRVRLLRRLIAFNMTK